MPQALMVFGSFGARSGFAALVFSAALVWFRLRVQFLCDNMVIVSFLNSGTSKSPDVMHLLRLLTLEAAAKILYSVFCIRPAEIIQQLMFCLVGAYRSSVSWLLTPISSPVQFRQHCCRSWYLRVDQPVFWSLGSGLGSIYSSCLRCWSTGLLPILLQFFLAVLSVIRMAAVICDLVRPDREFSSIFCFVLHRRCPFLAH